MAIHYFPITQKVFVDRDYEDTPAGLISGKERRYEDVQSLVAANVADNDSLYLAGLPREARIFRVLVKPSAAVTGQLTLSAGVATDFAVLAWAASDAAVEVELLTATEKVGDSPSLHALGGLIPVIANVDDNFDADVDLQVVIEYVVA